MLAKHVAKRSGENLNETFTASCLNNYPMKKLLALLLLTISTAYADSSLDRLGDEMANVLQDSVCLKRFDVEKVNRRHFRDYEIAENNPSWFKVRYEVPKLFGNGYVKGYVMFNPLTQNWACGSLVDNVKHDKKFGITGWDDASGTDAYKAFDTVQKSKSTQTLKFKHKHHNVKIDFPNNILTLKSKGNKPFTALHTLNAGEPLEFGFIVSNTWYKPKGKNFIYHQTNGLTAKTKDEAAVIKLNDENILTRISTALGDKKYIYIAVRQPGKGGYLIARAKR